MHCLTIFVIFCVISSTLALFLYEKEWQEFKATHNNLKRSRSYELNRRIIFENNLQKIEQHNLLYERGIINYKLGVTPFADLTLEEFQALLLLKKRQGGMRNGKTLFKAPKNKSSIPLAIDWRKKGAVTQVKQQGSCGCCWAFSETGSIEGQYFQKYGKLESFSEQQLIDCVTADYRAEGCNGAELDSGFKYIRDYGIELESSYPYEMQDNICRANDSLKITKIQDYVNIEPNNEEALLAAVGLIGPVSVAIDASDFNMQFYKEGIYESTTCSQTELNHAVLIVGYGSENEVDYWIVKNSWGKDFGVEGYIYMKRGINQCGISLEPIYPIL